MSSGVEQHRFVFIGGLPRSGTTFLASAIGRFEGVSDIHGTGATVAEEGQYLQKVYPTQQQAGGIAKFGYSSDMHLTEASPLATDTAREELWKAWSPYWDTDQPTLLEKTPSNMLKMRFLRRLFPESSFVVLVRHPVAQAMAVRSRGWTREPVSKLVDHWLVAHDRMSGDLSKLDRVIVVRYEDIVTSPGEMMAGIGAFLNLRGGDTKEDLQQGLNNAYFDEWKHGGPLAALSNRRTADRFESGIRRFGYSFTSPVPIAPMAGDLPTLPARPDGID
jgi:hypothetical protein